MSQAEFDAAYADAGKLQGGGDNDKLEFYALAKIAKGEQVTKPGMFDITGKYKFNAWQKEVDAGTTAEQARKKYVDKFNEMKAAHGLKG